MSLCRNLHIYGKPYAIEVVQRYQMNPEAPRLVIVGFQPNPISREILKLCVESIVRHTQHPYELWVVDNYSPPEYNQWLLDEAAINVVFNRTAPVPNIPFVKKVLGQKYRWGGSYANAVALEIAAKVIDPQSRYFMSLHMDTMACHPDWLTYLIDHLDTRVKAVGVRMDTARVRTVHVLGLMFDFTLWSPLKLTFQHDMPHYDVGDAISITLEKNGYRLWACSNTHWQPELIDTLPEGSPYRKLDVDRSLNDHHEVIFLHLGRGISKSQGKYQQARTGPEEWLRFGREIVLA